MTDGAVPHDGPEQGISAFRIRSIYLALQSNCAKKNLRLRQRACRAAARLSLDCGGRVEHHLFKDCKVLKVALSALYGDSTNCLRTIERIALGYVDKASRPPAP